MGLDVFPTADLLRIIKTEADAARAFDQVVALGQATMPSTIWEEYTFVSIVDGVRAIRKWTEGCFFKFPFSTGIYLGLDTEDAASNIILGFSNDCVPSDFTDEWIYDCDNFDAARSLHELTKVAASFSDEKWTVEERQFAKHLIYLGYSGIVFREALNAINTENDFLAVWGFHDGDRFLLTQKLGKNRIVLATAE